MWTNTPTHRFLACVGVVVQATASGAAAAQPSSSNEVLPAGFDATVASIMHEYRVPGLALAVVKDGKVVAAAGYGVRAIGKPDRVGRQTVFAIGSNTKAFTAAAAAMLVDDGRLEWDAPVSRLLPGFRMHDPWVTGEVSMRDLLSHRSGLGSGAGDLLLFPPSTHGRAEVVNRVAAMAPREGFRSAHGYNNLHYVIAAEAIAVAGGMTWERFIEERIFRRLGMKESYATPAKAAQAGNVASPHAAIDGDVRPIAPIVFEAAAPAGGIASTADDMAKWLAMLLREGALPDGSRLLSGDRVRELTALTVAMGVPKPPPDGSARPRSNFRGYGLGFVVQDYRGRKTMRHDGLLPGFFSGVTLVPEAGLGVVVLTNQEAAEAVEVPTRLILDHFLGGTPFDWRSYYRLGAERGRAARLEERRRIESSRDASRLPARAAECYGAIYRDPVVGDIVVTSRSGRLNLRFAATPALAADLEHWQGETFIARWRERELRLDAFVTFVPGTGARPREIRMQSMEDLLLSLDFTQLRPVSLSAGEPCVGPPPDDKR